MIARSATGVRPSAPPEASRAVGHCQSLLTLPGVAPRIPGNARDAEIRNAACRSGSVRRRSCLGTAQEQGALVDADPSKCHVSRSTAWFSLMTSCDSRMGCCERRKIVEVEEGTCRLLVVKMPTPCWNEAARAVEYIAKDGHGGMCVYPIPETGRLSKRIKLLADSHLYIEPCRGEGCEDCKPDCGLLECAIAYRLVKTSCEGVKHCKDEEELASAESAVSDPILRRPETRH